MWVAEKLGHDFRYWSSGSSVLVQTKLLFDRFLSPLANSRSSFWLYDCSELSIAASIY